VKGLRHEYKYHINKMEYRLLRTKLRTVMKQDPYAGEDGQYHIRSLYFDDVRKTALFEKLAGVRKRKKYRLRIYDLKDTIIKFECKSKIDNYVKKDIAQVARDDAERMIEGDIAHLRNSKEPLLRRFYSDSKLNILKPDVIVEYYREAYVYPISNVRITFDIGLHTGLNSVSLFDKNLISMGFGDYGIILEIKFNEILPVHIRGILPSSINPRTAIGKFVISKRYSKLNDWEDQ